VRVSLPNGFTPRPYQRRFMAHLDGGGKRAACVWHRRAGKDLVSLHQMCKMAHERKGVYWHLLPTYRQAKKALWQGFTKDGRKIIDTVFPSAIVKRKNESEMLVELRCGSLIQLVGSDTVDNLVGAGPVGVTFSEYSISRPKAWDFIRPMLAENGGWASFIYTPRGNNHGKKLYDVARKHPDEWYCELLTILQSGAFANPQGILDEERASGMPEPLVRQEYLCDFTAALVGAVWGDLLEGVEARGGLEDFQHERDAVFTSWDLGISDATSIWFWRLREGGVEFVDTYRAHGKPISHFLDVLEEKATTQRYRYVKHWLPHDARARTLATGTSVLEQMVARLGSNVAIGPALSLMDGIQAGRWLLQQEGTRFHPRCGEGIEALRQYHYEYDEDRKTFGSKPEHDWSSHDADAFRYAAVVVRATEMLQRKEAPKPARNFQEAPKYTLDELWDDRPTVRKERV
jgi:phage terminase large subunit